MVIVFCSARKHSGPGWSPARGAHILSCGVCRTWTCGTICRRCPHSLEAPGACSLELCPALRWVLLPWHVRPKRLAVPCPTWPYLLHSYTTLHCPTAHSGISGIQVNDQWRQYERPQPQEPCNEASPRPRLSSRLASACVTCASRLRTCKQSSLAC